ncbi:MAG: hypothetical protein ACM3KE_02300, partial [Hyphomicrobiales bacterium]
TPFLLGCLDNVAMTLDKQQPKATRLNLQLRSAKRPLTFRRCFATESRHKRHWVAGGIAKLAKCEK